MATKREQLYDYSGGIDLEEFREMVAIAAYYRDICAVTLSRFTGEKGAAISSQNIFFRLTNTAFDDCRHRISKKLIGACF